MDDDDDLEMSFTPLSDTSEQWSKEDATADILWFASAQAGIVAEYMMLVHKKLSDDANFEAEQREMHEAMTKEIETLPTFKEPEG